MSFYSKYYANQSHRRVEGTTPRSPFSRGILALIGIIGLSVALPSSPSAYGHILANGQATLTPLPLPTPLTIDEEKNIRITFLLQGEGRFDDAKSLARKYLTNGSFSEKEAAFFSPILEASNKAEAAAARERCLTSLIKHSTFEPDLSARKITHNRFLENQLHHLAQTNPVHSETLIRTINNAHGMTRDYAAWLETDISQDFLIAGDTDNTLEMARAAISNVHGKDATASFIAGLALWQKEAYRESTPFFEQATTIPDASEEIQSASTFWTARAHGKAHHQFQERLWLEKTAIFFPDTFYGFIALAMLDSNAILDGERKTIPQMWQTIVDTPLYAFATTTLKQSDINNIDHLPNGSQFFALLQIGERDAAEKFLLSLWRNTHNINLSHSFFIIAKTADLPAAQQEIAKGILSEQANYERRNDLPLPALEPQSGFIMDPALVYALTRVESNFNPRVRSGADARGLMQIQPVTADFITSSSMRHPNMWYRHHPNALFSPQTNLSLGQDYVQYLAKLSRHVEYRKTPGGDIIRILASYNAGPSALEQWENLTDSQTDDPLLFIEFLPNKETRDYVHKTLTYLWRYAAKMRITTPSLFALSQGIWPAFADETALAHNFEFKRSIKPTPPPPAPTRPTRSRSNRRAR